MYPNHLLFLSLALLSTLATAKHWLRTLELCPGAGYYKADVQDSEPAVQVPKAPKLNGYTGDILNSTRCYCMDEAKTECGYFHQADYYNYHRNQTYQTTYSCVDDCTYKNKNNRIPKCWALEQRNKHKECTADDENNKFCYDFFFRARHLGGPWALKFGLSPDDVYHFNDQQRVVDNMKPTLSPNPEECAAHCSSIGSGGMFTARNEDAWTYNVQLASDRNQTICNRKDVYEDTDDMCWNCK